MTTYSPTVRRRRLSRALSRLREEAGLDGAEVAQRLGWTPSKITTIERDQWRRPNPRDVKDLLDLYGVDDARRRDELLELARQSRARGWWYEYRDVLRSELVQFEVEATAIRTREVSVIPGLMQTASYARALFEGGRQDQIEQRVAARMRRQVILDRVALCAVIDEAAIRKRVGGQEVMAEQLRHLLDLSAMPNIAVRILPDEVGAHPAMGEAFTLLDFAEDPSLLFLETAAESMFRDEPERVAAYVAIYDQLKAVSLSLEESQARLAKLAAALGEG
ncbi:helix-turn-helix domain-containing protein [Nonomuraea sp. 10N515B]|uniref:helix-turn-helix domain-containing protein n=1 Tax=Nonomuraea sp. 10N515B TaxID=3457422 RepID=UPI003FCECD02